MDMLLLFITCLTECTGLFAWKREHNCDIVQKNKRQLDKK